MNGLRTHKGQIHRQTFIFKIIDYDFRRYRNKPHVPTNNIAVFDIRPDWRVCVVSTTVVYSFFDEITEQKTNGKL